MEGWVLLELCEEMKQERKKDVEVVVIKGVADYGDLTKGDKWQLTAAKAAIDYIHHCLDNSRLEDRQGMYSDNGVESIG